MRGSHFGKYLKELRKKHGMTLEVLGKKVSVMKGYISGIENSKVGPPSPKVVRKLAAVLGADAAYMLTLAWVDKAPAEIREDLVSLLVNPQHVAEDSGGK